MDFVSFIELFFVNVLLKQHTFWYKKCMLYYIYEKLQLNNNRVIVTLIVNILFSVSVCMDILLLIRQDYHVSKVSNGSTIIFFFSKFKAGLSLPITLLA